MHSDGGGKRDSVPSSFYYFYAVMHTPQVFTRGHVGLFSPVPPSVAALGVVTDSDITFCSNCPLSLMLIMFSDVMQMLPVHIKLLMPLLSTALGIFPQVKASVDDSVVKVITPRNV